MTEYTPKWADLEFAYQYTQEHLCGTNPFTASAEFERAVAVHDAEVRAVDLERERAFSEALGYGDDVTEPAASLEELVEPIKEMMAADLEHAECPVVCEQCGDRVAATLCPECGGSGLNNEASAAAGAMVECEWCAGSRKVHDCPGVPLSTLVAERDQLLARLEAVRAVAEGHRFRGRGEPDDMPDEFQTVADEVACDVLRALGGTP